MTRLSALMVIGGTMSTSDKVAMELCLFVMGIILGMPSGMLIFMLIHEFHATVTWLKQFPMWRKP